VICLPIVLDWRLSLLSRRCFNRVMLPFMTLVPRGSWLIASVGSCQDDPLAQIATKLLMNMPPFRDVKIVQLTFVKIVRRLVQTDAEG
jgi:hypothetical protein